MAVDTRLVLGPSNGSGQNGKCFAEGRVNLVDGRYLCLETGFGCGEKRNDNTCPFGNGMPPRVNNCECMDEKMNKWNGRRIEEKGKTASKYSPLPKNFFNSMMKEI